MDGDEKQINWNEKKLEIKTPAKFSILRRFVGISINTLLI